MFQGKLQSLWITKYTGNWGGTTNTHTIASKLVQQHQDDCQNQNNTNDYKGICYRLSSLPCLANISIFMKWCVDTRQESEMSRYLKACRLYFGFFALNCQKQVKTSFCCTTKQKVDLKSTGDLKDANTLCFI